MTKTPKIFNGVGIYSGAWDGQYLWWGLQNGSIIKMNPITYGYSILALNSSAGLIHHIQPTDDGFVWAFSWTNGQLWSINSATLTPYLYPVIYDHPHGLAFDGEHLLIGDFANEVYASPRYVNLHRININEPVGTGTWVLP